jgi:hypothetical protein
MGLPVFKGKRKKGIFMSKLKPKSYKRKRTSFEFSIDIQQSIVNAANYTVDCASVHQLHDRTLLIDKTRRRKILAHYGTSVNETAYSGIRNV